VARDKRFVLEQVHGGWNSHCTWCGESSGPMSTKSKTAKWQGRHAMTEFDLDLPEMLAYMRSR
jgi:hypothetical protein